jgi:hypothetical protein
MNLRRQEIPCPEIPPVGGYAEALWISNSTTNSFN